ncbi:transketolase [Cryobacterium melibiosiphilum]|uniref:transketolase n=1 Tax=Cryobacterium melibiosiphilum TaxID=995039 RepID=A0A3A5MHW1_9MICO|nr:transketolase [Cryobacterium melibiosiphilum]RJT88992.1 transketolase [Cryobacterium melibiosiphilum]
MTLKNSLVTIDAAVDPPADGPAEAAAVAAAIAIPAHIVQAKGHGHGGTAMALAPLCHVLFSRVLRHSPHNPHWVARDRLVLSAGHASLMLYVQLFLTGYGLTLEDIAASRTLGSRTPGHPEHGLTLGVEMSTGPLGQGVASAVGMAIAARKEAAAFTPGSALLDHTIWAIAGDGCLQEGVSAEASSLAGTLGLDNLVVLWDDNGVTIDGPTTDAFAEDVRARYRAYGWRVLEVVDATDLTEIERMLRRAAERCGRPTLVAVKTTIGAPSTVFGGRPAAHAGGFGAEEVAAVKRTLGFAADATLQQLVTPGALAFCRRAVQRGLDLEAAWNGSFAAWAGANPDSAAAWLEFRSGTNQQAVADALDRVAAGITEPGSPVATRKTNGAIIQALSGVMALWGGSADLSGSTNVSLPGAAVSAENPGGAFIHFGIREHAMAAILSGIALHGPWRPFASTYLVFSDYLRPALRLAALMRLPVIYVFTHDSVAVGEDGPTHQPVEQIASLRTVPGLSVVRPADATETVAAWRRLVARPEGSTALILSRQDVPVLERVVAGDARDGVTAQGTADATTGVAAGGYVIWQSGTGLDLALIATGSEVALAIAAARRLSEEDGLAVRVVSMPCVEWFAAAAEPYRHTVLPPSLTARVAVEAGRTDGWWRWVGFAGEVVGIDEFGESGSGPQVMALRGVTEEHVVAAARRVVARAAVA